MDSGGRALADEMIIHARRWPRCSRLIAVVLLGLIVVGVLFSRSGWSGEREKATPTVGSEAPDFALTTDAGKGYRLSNLRGKRVLLNFLCGCSGCRHLATEWERVHRRAQDVAVLGISAFAPSYIAEFRRTTRTTFPILFDANSEVAKRYDSLRCPRCWIVDERGRVAYVSPLEGDRSATIHALRRHLLFP